MKEREFRLHDGQMGSAITVKITPRSSRNEISEILADGTIKIRMTTSTDDEKSNQVLVNFLAEVLEIKPAQIDIVAGSKGIDKLITITDLEKSVVHERILKHIA